jgi:hypothetical protein
MLAANASNMCRLGITDPGNGNATSKPSPSLRGIKWM